MTGVAPSGRLIVLTNDLPYPPNHGHKVDQYHRWRGFADAGWRLRLICWRSPNDPPTSQADVTALGRVFEAADVLPIRHHPAAFARRLARLPRWPSHVASRIPSRAERNRLIAEAHAFAPDAVVLDGIYPGALGIELAKACGVPVVLRGHNVEHRYFAQQARATRSLRSKLAWTVARIGLRRFERALINRVAWTFDVSDDDVRYWREQGVQRIGWAPTAFPDADSGTLLPPAEKRWDVAYIGNLRLPNNLRGLRWFVEEVMPRLRSLRPGVSVCVAGANPGEEARALFATAPDIALVPDAPSADAILANGRVLVNPILSGSGINVKSIDMLRYDAPIVSTAVGVAGFAPEIREQFAVRSDPDAFAEAIAAALDRPEAPPGRAEARRRFGPDELRRQMADYARVIGLS